MMYTPERGHHHSRQPSKPKKPRRVRPQAQGLPEKMNFRMMEDIVHTLTETMTKSDIRGNDLDRGMDTKSYRFTVARPKKTIGEPIIIHETRNGTITQGSGLQAFSDVKGFGTLSQWTVNSNIGYSGFQSFKRYFDFNPSQNLTGSSLYNNVLRQPAADKFVLCTILTELDLVNFQNVACEVDVYWFTPRKDNSNLPLTNLWQSSLLTDANGLSQLTYPAAGTTADAFGSMTPAYYGLKPTEGRLFNSFYKILSKKKVLLDRGATMKMKYFIKMNQLADLSVIGQNNESFQKGCILCGIVVRSAVVVDDTASGYGGPTYGPVKLGYVFNSKHKFKQVRATVARQRIELGAYDINIGASLTNLHEMGLNDQATGTQLFQAS